MVWYPQLLKNFPQFVVIHTVKRFGIVNKAEIDCVCVCVCVCVWVCVFLELSYSLNDPTDVGNLISAFSKSSLNIWKLIIHVLLKPGLENIESYFASVLDKGYCQ